MKKYNELRNYEIRPFDRTKDFAKLLTLFVKIQEKIEIKPIPPYLKTKIRIYIFIYDRGITFCDKKSIYIDVFYDLDTNEPMGASFYHPVEPNSLNSRVKISGDLYLPFAFMDPSYKIYLDSIKRFFKINSFNI